MSYVAARGARGASLGLHGFRPRLRLGGLGATSPSLPLPDYYASPSSLRWTDPHAKALHDTLVSWDQAWQAGLRAITGPAGDALAAIASAVAIVVTTPK